MLRNYLSTALRAFSRRRLYSFINIGGLSVGLAAGLLIYIYVYDEVMYDRHIPDAERIYRVGINETFKGDEVLYSDTGSPLAKAMSDEIPEVESAVRLFSLPSSVKFDGKVFVEHNFLYADSNFVEFFGYPLVAGNAKECLKGPGKVLLSQSLAKKYFGTAKGVSVLGKQLIVGDENLLAEVTGVFSDVPSTTHMKFDIVMSLDSRRRAFDDCWACYGVKTYFKVTPQSNIGSIESKLNEFAQKRIIPRIEKDLKISPEEFARSGDRVSFFIQPLLRIHLESHLDNELEANGDLRYVYILAITGIFLILIACINFINLSTAQATTRSKEVGVRKTLGATRSELIPQFMVETFLYVSISGVLAMILSFALLGPFNLLSGKQLHIDPVTNPYMFPSIVGALVMICLLAGSYPAFYLTSFQPIGVLRGGIQAGRSKSIFRSGLVIFQFTISTVFIASTLIVNRQVDFLRNHELGFDKENVIRIPQTYMLGLNAKAFKDELLRETSFVNASYAESLPPFINSTGFVKADNSDQLVSAHITVSDYDLFKTMGYQMKSGRFFKREFPSDTATVLINESCARLLNYETHEGRTVSFGDERKWNVIGIIKDFNYTSLRSNVQPLVIFVSDQINATLAVRLSAGDPSGKIKKAESIWKKYASGQPFDYAFIDQDFNWLFQAEKKLTVILGVFTTVAIIIACLGLFGLITYVSGQRAKEIGIRKVMGASIAQISTLLLSDLMRLILFSLLVALPIAWYSSEQWLESFAYRIDFDIITALLSGGAAIIIGLITVGYQSVKASSVNPIDSLRND